MEYNFRLHEGDNVAPEVQLSLTTLLYKIRALSSINFSFSSLFRVKWPDDEKRLGHSKRKQDVLGIWILIITPTTPYASPRQGTKMTRSGPKAPDGEYS